MKKTKKLLGIALSALMLSGFFPVLPTLAAGEAVINFRLVDPTTNAEIKDLNDGGFINLAALVEQKVNIKAEVNGIEGTSYGSVRFNLDNGAWTRNESSLPYSLFGDSAGNYYATHSIALGTHTLTATPYTGSGATGTAGTALTINFRVVNDTMAPVISGVTNGSFYNTDVTVSVTDAGDANPITLLNGVEVADNVTVTEEGHYTVTARDNYGNVAAPVSFTIDKTAPVLTVNGLNPTPVERGEGYTEKGVTVEDSDNVVNIINLGSVNTAIVNTYPITYTATDRAGNVSAPVTRTVVVSDTIVPEVEIGTIAPQTDDILPVTHTAAKVKDPMPDSALSFGIGSMAWSKVSGPGTITFTPDSEKVTNLRADIEGFYVVKMEATDEAGNKASDTAAFVRDTVKPIAKAGNDVKTNKEVTLVGEATDATSGVKTVKWEVVSGPEGAVLTFGNSDQATTTAKADKEGIYVLRLTVTDSVGHVSVDEVRFNWDETGPNAASNFYLATGDKFVDLHWENPVDEDYSKVALYRSEVQSELGTLLTEIDKTKNVFSDLLVENGKTYYYTLRTLDDLGNAGEETDQLAATPAAPQLATVEEVVLKPRKPAAAQEVVTPVKNEVKGGTTEKNETKAESNKNTLPAFGIALLVILAIVGLYLLYLQNPALIKPLMFWKKKK